MKLNQSQSRIGTKLNDRYVIHQLLGQGGMGVVYRAEDTLIRRDVAIKLIASESLGTQGKNRLIEEARAAGSLNHPNIVTIYDVGEVDSQSFIVMELIDGDVLQTSPKQPLETILATTRQICAALSHAHKYDIIHRDLKPENVMVTRDGGIKLMDFGLARSLTSRLSEHGQLVGTVFYMSPEQALGQSVDERTDLYSLGVMLYEMTTGQLPFFADDAFSIITQHLHSPPVPPKAHNEDLPGFLNNLILNLLEKEPADRLSSAKEVLQALEKPEETPPDLRDSREINVLDRIVRGRILGRKEEMKEAQSTWNQARTGTGQVLLISGEPGIGKTRLMREVQTQAEVSGGTALIGAAYSESNLPYGAFGQIIRQALKAAGQHEIELPDPVLSDLLTLVPDMAHRYPEITKNPPLDPDSEKLRLFEHIWQFCLLLSKHVPLLIVVDDVHWADGGSLAIFQHLARRVRQLPALLLGTYREVELRAARPFNEMLSDLIRERQCTRIKLNRLNEEQTRDMLAAIFNESITDEFLAGIYKETDGNPFFIEEVCRSLVESGKLYFRDGVWHRPAMEDLDIPQGIQVSVELRLANLPEAVQDALRSAAVLGREFDFEILTAAGDLGEDELIDAMERAESAQMIEPLRGRGVMFQFVHALVPQAIYESIHLLRRRKLHRRAAEAIEKQNPDDYASLAYHFSRSGQDDKALDYLLKAGRQALKSFAGSDAEKHFEAALHLVEEPGQKAEVLGWLGDAFFIQGRYQESRETWEKAVPIFMDIGEIDIAARYYARMARAADSQGDTTAALEVCRLAVTSLSGAADGPGWAELLSEACRTFFFSGLERESKQYGDMALDLAARLNLPLVEAETLATLGMLVSPEEGVRLLEKAVEISLRHNLLLQADRAFNNLAIAYIRIGDTAKARSTRAQALEFVRKRGSPGRELWKRANDFGDLINRLDFEQARSELQEMAVLAELVAQEDVGYHNYLKALNEWDFNVNADFEAVLSRTQQLDEIAESAKRQDQRYIFVNLIISLILMGRISEAAPFVQDYFSHLDERDDPLDRVGHRFFLMFYFFMLRDFERVRSFYKECTAIARANEESDEWLDSVMNAVGSLNHLAEGRQEDAIQNMNESLAYFKMIEFYWDYAYFHVLYSMVFFETGREDDRAAGFEIFEKARDLFTEMKLDGWVRYISAKIDELKRRVA